MKAISLLILLAFSISAGAQSITITDMDATAVPGGINVNLKTISYNGAGYLSHSYSISGATIDLSVCYYFNLTLPVLSFENDFFIPVTESGNYTVNVTVYNSSSDVECDYFSSGGSATDSVLATDVFADRSKGIYPNPTTGIIYLADTGIDRIDIYDSLGRLVGGAKPIGNSIDVSALNSGIYLLVIDSGTNSFTQKLIKK